MCSLCHNSALFLLILLCWLCTANLPCLYSTLCRHALFAKYPNSVMCQRSCTCIYRYMTGHCERFGHIGNVYPRYEYVVKYTLQSLSRIWYKIQCQLGLASTCVCDLCQSSHTLCAQWRRDCFQSHSPTPHYHAKTCFLIIIIFSFIHKH